jgi:cytochrome c oxidase subunit 2
MTAPSAPTAFSPVWPLGYLTTFGPRADPATTLTWGLMDISIAVIVIVTALVVIGMLVKRVHAPAGELPSVSRGGAGLNWIYIGVALTVVVLLASMIWTVQVLAEINSPASKPAFTIEITGHQWWWEARYLSPQPDQDFTTANELHIPVGQPVLIKVMSADVIHSFWIPALTGKTDTIPGRVNLGWMQANRPGVYRGQCTEYCGEEHAKMALYAIAQPPAEFEAWRQGQVMSATPPADPQAVQGAALFNDHCGACHEVRGTTAGGLVGPDLTHLASRQTIASGILPNTPAALGGWISDPQTIKPSAKMPATDLSGPQLNAVVAYLGTLK